MIILSCEQFDSIVEHAKNILPNEDGELLGGTIDGDRRINVNADLKKKSSTIEARLRGGFFCCQKTCP